MQFHCLLPEPETDLPAEVPDTRLFLIAGSAEAWSLPATRSCQGRAMQAETIIYGAAALSVSVCLGTLAA
ncbi:MAG TPA: hypothetical protein VGD42_19760, partial [Lysobacter sp.]